MFLESKIKEGFLHLPENLAKKFPDDTLVMIDLPDFCTITTEKHINLVTENEKSSIHTKIEYKDLFTLARYVKRVGNRIFLRGKTDGRCSIDEKENSFRVYYHTS